MTLAPARHPITYAIAAGALAASTMIGSGALAATGVPDPAARQAWREALSRIHLPAAACFKANYPDVAWTRVACTTAPQRPYLPAHGGAANVGSNTVGDGHDYAAGVTGLISSGTGSFYKITGLTSETGFLNQANTYSLQLNSNFFTTTVCNGAADPSSCLGWEQFVYSNDGSAFMQYWLIDYGPLCPSGGWMPSGTDCYKNSAAVAVPKQPLAQLANLSVSGTAVANGTDTMIFTTASSAYTTTGKDSVVELAAGWNASEYNVIGDGDGSKAKFNTGTSITVEIALKDGSTAAPTCETNAGTTAETNNLTLGGCKTFAGPSPTLGFVESN
jgi:hypothetical protein